MRNGPAETNRLLTSRKSRRTARLTICWTLQRSSQAAENLKALNARPIEPISLLVETERSG
ncbi:hypothetical protein SM0020_29565 [Sinorhizobium meliloti CCNWSX0020]|uniref:Uncharacterized protein n=1 Tax=Sinorhizobium meliloti CCNWSX0020 TaxID=1107881 RepID=H0G8S2_RHIML|nr:hypothetical protein SM0020_29565 [Sinorhizobium meliloti CCNWSX0020]